MQITLDEKKPKKTVKDFLSYLDKTTLTQEERILLFNHLNKSLNTFPINDVIVFRKDGALLYNGVEMTLEQVQNFKQSVASIKDNPAFRIICDQVLFKAIQTGIHLGLSTDQIIFSKAAIYFITQFREQVEMFDRA